MYPLFCDMNFLHIRFLIQPLLGVALLTALLALCSCCWLLCIYATHAKSFKSFTICLFVSCFLVITHSNNFMFSVLQLSFMFLHTHSRAHKHTHKHTPVGEAGALFHMLPPFRSLSLSLSLPLFLSFP